MRHRIRTIGLILLFVLLVGVGWWWQNNTRHGKYRDIVPAFYIMGVVGRSYYQPVNLTRLMTAYWRTGTISGMLKVLNDPYTRFLSKTDFADLRKDTQGSFGGIGIYLLPKEDELIVAKVVGGSPGERAGLQKGDRIIGVNGQDVRHLSSTAAVAKIRGPAGSTVSLRLERGNGKAIRQVDVFLTREIIKIPTVEMTSATDPVAGKYATVYISQFAQTTGTDLNKIMDQIDRSGGYRGIILDLRENPGGSLEAAIQVISRFVPDGTPILYVYRRGRLIQTITSEGKNPNRLPLVIVVNGWSASAAEIVSGALKDLKRATIVGTNTFGKDLIQEVKDLPGDVGVTVTVANYLTPGKVSIHKKGVIPNRRVEIPGALEKLMKTGNQADYLKMQQQQNTAALEELRRKVGRRIPALPNAS